MPIETMLTDDYDPEFELPDAPDPGRYHAVIVRVDEDGGKNGEMIVDYEIIAGTTANQEGKIFRDYFGKAVKQLGRIHTLAMACGFVTAAQLKDMKERGQSPVYDFEGLAIGKHVHLDLYNEEYQGKTKVKCGFGIYLITEKRCEKWPKNLGMLAKAGVVLAAPQSQAPTQQRPATPAATHATQQAAATAPSPVDDLLSGVV